MITKNEMKTEAKKIMKDLFSYVVKSDVKEDWQKAFEFIQRKISLGGREKFVYLSVRNCLLSEYGKKFIKPLMAK